MSSDTQQSSEENCKRVTVLCLRCQNQYTACRSLQLDVPKTSCKKRLTLHVYEIEMSETSKTQIFRKMPNTQTQC
jgi:hypothetical protein